MENNPDIVQKVNDFLIPFKEYNPSWTYKESNYSFVECSLTADHIKWRGGGHQSIWHYITNPFYNEGGDATTFPDFTVNPENIINATT